MPSFTPRRALEDGGQHSCEVVGSVDPDDALNEPECFAELVGSKEPVELEQNRKLREIHYRRIEDLFNHRDLACLSVLVLRERLHAACLPGSPNFCNGNIPLMDAGTCFETLNIIYHICDEPKLYPI